MFQKGVFFEKCETRKLGDVLVGKVIGYSSVLLMFLHVVCLGESRTSRNIEQIANTYYTTLTITLTKYSCLSAKKP